MSIKDALNAIDDEISKLQQVRLLLAAETPAAQTGKRRGRPKNLTAKSQTNVPEVAGKTQKRKMSAAGKARIAAAQKVRWAAQKEAAATAKRTVKNVVPAEKNPSPKIVAKKLSGKKMPSKKVLVKTSKLQETRPTTLPESSSSPGAEGVS